MAFKKGHKLGKGRPKGSGNKTTTETREAFKKFVEDNTSKFQGWIDRVAADDPEKALKLVIDTAEYILPKLSRTELKAEVKEVDAMDFDSWDDNDIEAFIKLGEKYKTGNNE